MGKNNLLSGISKSRSQIDKPQFSKRVVAFGVLLSYCLMLVPAKEYLMERDNAEVFVERYEVEKENLSEEENILIEKALQGEIICDDVFWGEYDEKNENENNDVCDSLILIHKSRLYELLMKARKDFLEEEISESLSESELKEKWKNVTEEIISDYLSGNIVDDETGAEINNDFIDMEKKLYNEVLIEFLYDQYSLKKEADLNGAQVVTEQLISEVENETLVNLDELFEMLKYESNFEEESYEEERDEWFENFQKYINDGIAKWQKIEKDFLDSKYSFENEAGEKYTEYLNQWTSAYDEFLERKEKWNIEIEQRLSEGIVLWQQKSEKLNSEIDKIMEDYKNELLTEYRQKNEEFCVNCEIYQQTRTLLSTACNEVEEWFALWSDKYDGLYSYWKTESDEENEVNPLSNYSKVSLENCDELIQTVNKVKNRYNELIDDFQDTDEEKENAEYRDFIDNKQILISELDILENWLLIVSDYSEILDSSIKNLERAGFDYSDEIYTSGKSDTERKILENKLKICAERLDEAKAVYEYSIDNTSNVEKKEETEEKLKNSKEKTDLLNEEYQILAGKLEDAKHEYEIACDEYENQKKITESILQKLNDAKVDYRALELKTSFTELEALKSEYILIVNSINRISSDSSIKKEKVIELNSLMRDYSYEILRQKSYEIMESEYSNYDVENNDDNVNYETVAEEYQNYLSDYYQKQDSIVKKEIKRIINEFSDGKNNSINLKTDIEIESFITELDNVVSENDCSDFVKQELDLYKNQIANIRNQKEIKEQIENISSQINGIFNKDIIISSFKYDSASLELFFDEDVCDVSDEELVKDYDDEYEKLYEAIFENQSSYENLVNQLMNKAVSLISENNDCQEALEMIDFAKKNVSYINDEYYAAVEKCNGTSEDSCFNKVKIAIEKYNELISQINEKYSELEDARHNEDVCREVYEWAQNEYLHLGYETENMISPAENYENALKEYENAVVELEKFNENYVESDYEKRYEIYDENGNNVFIEYENRAENYCAAQVFKYELEEAINKQYETVYKAQLEEEMLFNQIIKETDENDFKLNDLIRTFVDIKSIETENGLTYEIAFNDGEKDDNELFEQLCKEYVTERNIVQYNCDGEMVCYSKSQIDALNFMDELSEKEYTVDDLLLALCFIKMNMQDESLFYAGEKPDDLSDNDLSIFPENLEGIHIIDEYKEGRLLAVEDAYKKVIENGGIDDIAKLIFYSEYNLNDSYNLKNREIDWISLQGLEHVYDELTEEYKKNNNLFVIFEHSSMCMYILSGFPFCKWALAIAAGLQITAFTYERAAEDIDEARKDIAAIQDGYTILYNEIISNADNVVEKWIASKEKLENETLLMNTLLYGNEDISDGQLTFERFDSEVREILDNDKDSAIGYEYLSNLYVNNNEINSFRELFEKSTENHNCETTIDALHYIYEYIESLYFDTCEKISECADKSRQNEGWNEVLYQREIGKISYDNFVKDVPVKINRVQESYITDGMKILSSCYENILDEYYANLIIQKENELNMKRDKLSEQFSGWVTQIKNVKEISELEWNKSEEEFKKRLQSWNDDFINDYNESEKQFDEIYKEMLTQKSEWITKNYTEQALGLRLVAVDENDFNDELENIKVKTKEIIDNAQNVFEISEDLVYSEKLSDISAFENISSYIDTLNNEALRSSVSVLNAEMVNFFDYEREENIGKIIQKLDSDILENSILFTAENALKTINDRIDELYEQIDCSNKNIEQWEKELVLKDGYTYGDEISRNAIVHSVIFGGNIREKQTVHKYEYFTCLRPDIAFSLSKNDSYETISLMLENSMNKLGGWYEDIFGNNGQEGLFEKHVGIAPVFVENVNIKKNCYENISKAGSGQMGMMMLDFIWNSAVNREGYSELAVPMYDKKLTVENQIFGIELPTLRDITSMVFDIVSNCTGMVWVTVMDDFMFGMMDLDFEQKDFSQVTKELFKAGASIGINAIGSNVINSVGEKAISQTSKMLINTGVKSAQSYANAVAASYIDAADFSNGFTIDWNKANRVWTDENVLKNSISAGALSFVNDSLNNLTLTDGSGRLLNDSYYNVSAVESLNSTLSVAAVAGTEMLLSGTTTVNILNVGGTGLLALTLSDDGVSAKISSDGHNLNVADAINGISGIGDAAWVTGAKVSAAFGNENNVALLNGINCLSYYSPERAGELAKEIWNGEKIVKIADMNALGRTFGNVIEVSDKIAGNNDESAVQVASILLHEDAHSQGLDEFQSRIVGYNLYVNMSGVYDTSQGIYDKVSDVAFFTEAWKQGGDEALYTMLMLTEAFSKPNDGWDYYFAETIDIGWRQKRKENDVEPLGEGWIRSKIEEYNSSKENEMYDEYMSNGYFEYIKSEQQKEDYNPKNILSYDEFCSSGIMEFENKKLFVNELKNKNKALEQYQFAREKYIGLGDYGCVLSTAAYISYSITGEVHSLLESNEICREAGLFNNYNQTQKTLLCWEDTFINAVNAIAGKNVLANDAYRVRERGSMNYELNKVEKSDDGYFIVGRVNDDSHAVLIKNEQFDYQIVNGVKYYNSLDVINSWDVKTKSQVLEKTNYSLDEISNLTFYKVEENYKNEIKYRATRMKDIKDLYYK